MADGKIFVFRRHVSLSHQPSSILQNSFYPDHRGTIFLMPHIHFTVFIPHSTPKDYDQTHLSNHDDLRERLSGPSANVFHSEERFSSRPDIDCNITKLDNIDSLATSHNYFDLREHEPGEWDLSEAAVISCCNGDGLNAEQAVREIVALANFGLIWAASGNQVLAIDAASLCLVNNFQDRARGITRQRAVRHSFLFIELYGKEKSVCDMGTNIEVHPNPDAQVRTMVPHRDGVWIAIRGEPVIRLYSAFTMEHLQDVDVQTPIHQFFGWYFFVLLYCSNIFCGMTLYFKGRIGWKEIMMWSHRKLKEDCSVGKTVELCKEVLGSPFSDPDETVLSFRLYCEIHLPSKFP
ncbi:unnamed protein product [Protopolystoma xenopodis]|uniref:Uncharacterized protein n=1 Tax=Protopolystoma xenopodis TaxID=117903 RepID=A0A3S5FCE6_9PLAT|nr:unnamed protein product [Protopolystoma xenopodis]